jgi:hypothetical protein
MMAKIKSYSDLKQEQLRLEGLLAMQGALIKKDVSDLREELKPVRAALQFTGKLISKDKTNPLLNIGIDFIGDTLFKNFLFAKSGFLIRSLAPLLLKNLGSNYIARNGDGLLDQISHKLKDIAAGFFKKKAA